MLQILRVIGEQRIRHENTKFWAL